MQDRLKAMQQAKKEASGQTPLDLNLGSSSINESANPKANNLVEKVRLFFNTHLAGISKRGSVPPTSTVTLSIKPTTISNGLTYIFMLLTAVALTYWVMRIAQIPGVPSQPANGITKGMTLYSNQDSTSAYGLFGNKPIVTDNIYLRGVVITSKSKDGTLDGFAIFEIDGKPTNAISVGESLGKGLSLQSIGDESATLLYQGQKLNFKLSKPGKDKSNSKK